MRTLKILVVVLAAPVFAAGAATIFGEVKKRITNRSSADMAGCAELQISETGRFEARIIKIPERGQTMIQIFDGHGNQVDVTCDKDRMRTSHMVRDGLIYTYFDRDGDGMPELRSKKDPETRKSVFEHLQSPQWAARSSTQK